jgi:large subunit ribosomal protein L32e
MANRSKDIKKLLQIRKQKKRKRRFIRESHGILRRIDDKWRRPRGRHSKLRHQAAGHRKKVKPGFRTDKAVRGLDNSGLVPVIIHSLNHIPLLNKSVHGAIVGSSVGKRKKLLLLAELKKHGIKVLNLKEGYENKIIEEFENRKKAEEEKSKKAEKSREKPGEEEKKLTEEEKQIQEKKEKDRLLTKEHK